MAKKKYRSKNMIIQNILEGILQADLTKSIIKKGIIKSHLIKYCGLKSSTAEEYLVKLEKADYIVSHSEYWGERKITVYDITLKGKERYYWFVKINAELS